MVILQITVSFRCFFCCTSMFPPINIKCDGHANEQHKQNENAFASLCLQAYTSIITINISLIIIITINRAREFDS